MLSRRRLMWLARLAVLGAVALVLLVNAPGFGGVHITARDEMTIYYVSPVVPLAWAVACLLAVLGGVAFLFQPGRIYKVLAAWLIVVGVTTAVWMLPETYFPFLTLTPDRLHLRLGTSVGLRDYVVPLDQVARRRRAARRRRGARTPPSDSDRRGG